MKNINIFVDTSIINKICDIDIKKTDHQNEEDRKFLSKILENSNIKFLVNPSIKQEIENTQDQRRREELLNTFSKYHFIPFNKFIWGKTKDGKEKSITFPVNFLKPEEKEFCEELEQKLPRLKDDMKIIADGIFNKDIDILLSTDIHIYKDLVKFILKRNIKVKVFNPKECFNYLKTL